MAVDLMKLCRQPVTIKDVAKAIGASDECVSKWLHEFEQQGLVTSRQLHIHGRGVNPRQYRLTSAWGGSKSEFGDLT